VWSEDDLVTKKKAFRLEVIRRYLTCYSSLICIAELFANLVDSDASP